MSSVNGNCISYMEQFDRLTIRSEGANGSRISGQQGMTPVGWKVWSSCLTQDDRALSRVSSCCCVNLFTVTNHHQGSNASWYRGVFAINCNTELSEHLWFARKTYPLFSSSNRTRGQDRLSIISKLRELISTRKTSGEHNSKELNHLR